MGKKEKAWEENERRFKTILEKRKRAQEKGTAYVVTLAGLVQIWFDF